MCWRKQFIQIDRRGKELSLSLSIYRLIQLSLVLSLFFLFVPHRIILFDYIIHIMLKKFVDWEIYYTLALACAYSLEWRRSIWLSVFVTCITHCTVCIATVAKVTSGELVSEMCQKITYYPPTHSECALTCCCVCVCVCLILAEKENQFTVSVLFKPM